MHEQAGSDQRRSPRFANRRVVNRPFYHWSVGMTERSCEACAGFFVPLSF